MRVAVVGGGVSGLAAAHELLSTGGGGVRVTLYEEEESLGGHDRTVAVSDGAAGSVQLDLGFLSFNQVTYPHMMEWLEGLGVEMERSDMSFSVSAQSDGNGRGCEWGNGNGVSSLLAQKANILKTSFWRMFYEILKFKKDALTYLEYHEHNPDLDRDETLGLFIQSHGYSLLFQEAYLIPVCAGSWSCSSQGVLSLSAFFVLSFFRNHDLLQLFRHSQLPTAKPSSESYVNKGHIPPLRSKFDAPKHVGMERLEFPSQVLALGFDERFIRIWEYYFIFSAAGFKSRALGDYQVRMSAAASAPSVQGVAEGGARELLLDALPVARLPNEMQMHWGLGTGECPLECMNEMQNKPSLML
ncbi:hypothetical protein ACQ4PT_043423 [Festuca glaucescens]